MFAQTHGNSWTIYRLRSQFYARSLAFPVLVIALDPANVERILETIANAFLSKNGMPIGIRSLAVAEALNLTPAKRRGKTKRQL